MSIFGQVWLWSLLAFVVGALLTWLVLVLPARKRIRELEGSLATVHAEKSRLPAGVSLGAGAAAAAGGTAYFTKPSHDELDEEFAATEEPQVPKPAYPETLAEQEPAQLWSEPVIEEQQTPEHAQDVHEDFTEEPTPEPEPAPAATQTFEPEDVYEAEYRTAPETHLEPEPESAAERTQFIPAAQLEPEPEPEPANPYAAAATEYLQPASQLDVEPEPEPETPAEATQVLPKRTPRGGGGAVRGGFEPPQPIQPSMRAIERREPDLSGGQSGSLFEPAVQPGDAMPAPEPPPARQVAAPVAESVPPGPFGPGSAMPRPGGGRPADDFAVKASVTALRYCTEDSAQFPKMVAEVWFRSASDAERVGFRPLS